MLELKSFLFALGFLTRIPIPFDLGYNKKMAANSMSYYPLVGLIIAFILIVLDITLSLILPLSIVNILLLFALVYLTGGLHLDGFIDTIDGIYSGRDKERILEIMHDSRIGAFGVVAVILLFLIKYNLFLELTGAYRLMAFLLMPVIARLLIVFTAYLFPLASSSSIGKDFTAHLSKKQVIKSLLIFLLIIFAMYLNNFSLLISFLVFIISFLLSIFFVKKIINKIGGLTGDIYGAIIELMELAILLMFLVFQGLII